MPTSTMKQFRKETDPAKLAQKDKLTQTWQKWRDDPSDDNFSELLQKSQPVIDKAVTSYAPGSSPAVRSMAKVYARKAFDTYDPKKGTKLQTYLHTQLQPLRREAASYSTLHVPENVRTDLRHLQMAQKEFEADNGREPTLDELSDRMKLSQKRLEHIMKFQRPVVSDSDIFSSTDEFAESAPAVKQPTNLWADFVYDELSDKDKLIYDMRMGRLGKPPAGLAEIARKTRMTPSAVSQRLGKISARIQEGEKYADLSR